ncbi:MAG: energy-coupling factor ABC transporter ATP-binding protein [Anaerolineales bacterium]
MIRIKDLSYHYPATEQPALRDLSLHVEEGEFLAVVGPNGAGKSTLCFALSGFIPHFYGGELSGQIQVAGQDLHQTGPDELAGEVGLVFQDPFNQISGARFTVREEIAFGLENLGVPPSEMEGRIQRVLKLMELEQLGDRSPYALSGGQQQRLALASVVVMEPKLLILDEPTSQLDPIGTRDVFQALRNLTEAENTTIVMVEHKLEWVATFSDRVAAMSEGKILGIGTAREILTSEKAMEAGIGQTQFTEVGRQARQRGWVSKESPLPVSLENAVEYFS